MAWLKDSKVRCAFSRLLLALLLAGLSLFIGLAALSTGWAPGRAAAEALTAPVLTSSTMSVTFGLDDFDDPKRESGPGSIIPRPPNDFFAAQSLYTIDGTGAVITPSLTCPYTYSCYLSLAYDVSAQADSEGGYVEELAYSYNYDGGDPSTWTLRDMSACTALRFRVRGDALSPYTTRFDVEFVGQDWGAKSHHPVTGVTSNWQDITIPLAGLTNMDVARLKHIAIRLQNGEVTAPSGVLHFDDFAFTGCRFEGDLLDLLERHAFYYFWESRHPDTGFVRDRAIDPFYARNITSIAAIGFELAAFGIGAEHGWVSRANAAEATLQVLDSLWVISPTASHQGFYYHFLDIETGQRDGDSELSTIDTALMMAGVLFARQYFTGEGATEIAIRERAGQLFDAVNWGWALRTDPVPAAKYNQFHMAWKPEFSACCQVPAPGGGYFDGVPANPTTWDYYTDEILLINLLAIGSPAHPVPTDTFAAWRRESGTYDGYTLYTSWFGQLFAHFIGQGWLDLRHVTDPNGSVNWFQNSRQAALANRQFVIDQSVDYVAYSSQSWGLSPCLGPPDDALEPGWGGVGVYRTYGGLPKGEPIPPPPNHDGTVAPHAAAGSIVFLGANPAENEAYQALDHWYQTQPRLWGLYGFRDGFNLGRRVDDPAGTDPGDDWFAHDYLGLDQGMTLLALENYQTGLVWRTMGRDPVVSRGLCAVFECNIYLPIVLKH
jgi:hypothetical protein